MNNSFVIILLLSFTLVISGCGTSRQVDTFLKETESQVQSGSGSTPSTSISNSTEIFEKISSDNSSTENISSNGEYKEYSQSDFDTAIAAGKTVVLTRYTPSCPTCVALEKSLSRSTSRIPSNTVIMKIDQDQVPSLTNHYKVEESNTVIILNTDGSEKRRASGGIYTIDKLLYYL